MARRGPESPSPETRSGAHLLRCRLRALAPGVAMTKPTEGSLYDPAFERDSCGFGLIANLDDEPSAWVVETAVGALKRLTHRGAVAADGKTADGCGLLLKTPDRFLRGVAADAGIELSQRYAAGTVFLHRDADLRERGRRRLEEELARAGLGPPAGVT